MCLTGKGGTHAQTTNARSYSTTTARIGGLSGSPPPPLSSRTCRRLLFIADGLTPAHVAKHRLLRPRDPDTVYTWLKRYQQEGLAGLFIRQGRGRKPAFFPAYQSTAEAQEAVAHVIKRDPRQFGINRTRWNLPTLLTHLPEFHLAGPSSLWRVLDRLDIRWLRGHAHVHSPDPLYQHKRDYIQQIDLRVRSSGGKEVLLYQDECSYDHQPLVTSAYAPSGEPEQADLIGAMNSPASLACSMLIPARSWRVRIKERRIATV